MRKEEDEKQTNKNQRHQLWALVNGVAINQAMNPLTLVLPPAEQVIICLDSPKPKFSHVICRLLHLAAQRVPVVGAQDDDV